MLYHRQLGYGLHDGADMGWSFRSALTAMGLQVTDAELGRYRDYFIEHGFGKFDGKDDPTFRISAHGEQIARTTIARRWPWYSLRRIRTYDWSFWGAIAAIVAAIFSFASLLTAS